MHWFWRAMIAVALGCVPCVLIIISPLDGLFYPLQRAFGRTVATWLLLGFPSSLVSVFAYSTISRLLPDIDIKTRRHLRGSNLPPRGVAFWLLVVCSCLLTSGLVLSLFEQFAWSINQRSILYLEDGYAMVIIQPRMIRSFSDIENTTGRFQLSQPVVLPQIPTMLAWKGFAFVLPLYIPLVITLAVVVVWAWRWRRHLLSLIEHRRCVSCNYDLTGNTSGVCPECGETVSSIQGKES